MNTQNLPVRLTTDELLMRSDELAKTIRERDETERDMKSAQGNAKRKIDKLELDITRLAEVVRDRKENRPVEVTEFKNWARLTMDTVRIDTGEIVGSRSMSAYERNEALPFAADETPRDLEGGPAVEEPAPEPAEAAQESSAQEPSAETPAPTILPAEEPVQAAPEAAQEPASDKPAVN